LPLNSYTHFLVLTKIFPVVFREWIEDNSQEIVPPSYCKDDDGEEIECWRIAIRNSERAQTESDNDLNYVDKTLTPNYNGTSNVTVETNFKCDQLEGCGEPCAKGDPECPEGSPELWFTYADFQSAVVFIKVNEWVVQSVGVFS